MSQSRTLREQCHTRKLLPCAVENTLDSLGRAQSPVQLPVPTSMPDKEEDTRRNISGQLLDVSGAIEVPVENALIEVHAVTPLKQVVNTLSCSVLAHCRKLLLETVTPVDLYQASKHVADKPLLSFADVQRLRDIPGYELLAAAARSQTDASFKRLLYSNPTIAGLLLCYYHPASFPVVHLTNTTTDDMGRFQCAVLESGNADERQGYLFIARHKVSSHLYITLYHPTPVTWYTHWELSGEGFVTLRTRHPLTLRKNTPM